MKDAAKDAASAKTSYHHGDLRQALIEEGMRLLAKSEADDLSLREVARNVGVSATAVYRHFPDKGALMSALAAEGLKKLGEEQRAVYAASGGGVKGFGATGSAYVRFALDNPALFRLIFSGPQPPYAEDDAASFLQANAAALAPPGSDPKIFALQAWSVAHGLAMLMLDGQVPVDNALIDKVIDAHDIAVTRR
jgi:AcrR family transcriptional regulator